MKGPSESPHWIDREEDANETGNEDENEARTVIFGVEKRL
jgi:hypothetical protein